MQLLEKELSEGRSSFGKLQGSTNSTVNGLLEELRATEDALSLERRRGSSELELARGRVAELQSALEKAREHIDESNDRSKKERGDKEMRMLQLENEMDRIKVRGPGRGLGNLGGESTKKKQKTPRPTPHALTNMPCIPPPRRWWPRRRRAWASSRSSTRRTASACTTSRCGKCDTR